MTLNDLLELLQRHSIPLELWGKGNARAVTVIHDEVCKGEAKLIPIDTAPPGDSTMLREIHTAAAHVVVEFKRYRYALVQVRQEHPDGTVTVRRHPSSISEKVRWLLAHPETWTAALLRAFREELGIRPASKDLISLLFYHYEAVGPKKAQSFPGFDTLNHLGYAIWRMPLRRYRHGPRKGRFVLFRRHYVEVTKDGRRIYFGWRRIGFLQSND